MSVLPKLFAKLNSAIVQITTKYVTNLKTIETATASGFLYTYRDKVYVITNAHVVLHSTVTDPVARIYCGLTNINQCAGKNFVVLLKIVGVDATSDIAVCDFDEEKNITEHIPVAEHSNSLEFGDNRKEKVGNMCFTIGDPLDADSSSLTTGIIRDEKFTGVKGVFINEQITTDFNVYPSTSGAPIFNKDGLVIGMISFAYSLTQQNIDIITPGFSGGISSHIMKPVIHNLIKKVQSTQILFKGKHMSDVKSYYSYRKGYLGDIDWVGVTPTTLIQLYPQNYKNLKIKGIIITKVNSDQNVLKHKVQEGDIITEIQTPSGEFVKIGTHDNEYSIGSVLWYYDPNESPKIKLKVIHDPNKNYKESVVQIKLDINYNPEKESPPKTTFLLSKK